MSMRWLISFLIAASVASAAPRLAVAIDQAITIFDNRDEESPTVDASTFTGTVKAECHQLKSAAGKWDAEIRFEVTEAPGNAPFAGSATLRLAIELRTSVPVLVAVWP